MMEVASNLTSHIHCVGRWRFAILDVPMQKQAHPGPRESHSRPNVSLLMTLADTTWRMLIPSAIFVCIGIYADLHLGTKPWLTLTGVACGLGVSVILIKNQLGAVR